MSNLAILKWWPIKVFVTLHKSLFLIADIVKDAVSGLIQILSN